MPHGVLTRRKTGVAFSALFLAAALIIGGCSSKQAAAPGGGDKDKAAAKAIELKLAHFWPSAHWVETQAVKEWSKAVEDATNGRVKITSYPTETLLKSAEIYDGVIKGVADIGISCYAYNRGVSR